METKWTIKPTPNLEIVESFKESLGVPPIIATLLAQRDIRTFEEAKLFFRPQLDHLHDPFLMKDMRAAVDRLYLAISNNEKILVYGDYDVDGTTSVSMMHTFLKQVTDNVHYYIPDRYNEGYGVSFLGIDYAFQNDYSLIISLDCGIKANQKVDYANEKNIDFIICDHHRPGLNLPQAIAVLDPKREDCNYPYTELSGCGVGFKLIQAYCIDQQIEFEKITHLLDLLAVSIAADIVPITGENRVMAYYGLKQINSNPRPGLKALISASQRTKEEYVISDVVFGIAPRINAAGRIDHAKKAVELLIEKDYQTALQLAELIEANNKIRKELDSSITEEALQLVLPERRSTVVFKSDWHKGVIGIVASRVIEHHYRPTIVLTESKGFLVGSARSVSGFDVYNAIDACSHLVEQFGGHKYAAGLSIKKENLSQFVAAFEKVVSETITEDQLYPEILIDNSLDFNEIDHKTYRLIKQMAPFGPGNGRPVFITENIFDSGYGKAIGKDQTHLKLSITDAEKSNKINAIGFGMATKLDVINNHQSFDICYCIEENEWNGSVSLQLRLKDIK
ncbi:single-stranded-DNA-specific exonuclease RecJ [Flavobacteriales bacterium]|nr:single-stranded-DNA-specific exonuclease RecJ [Flavobacteriales bacterium]